MRAEALPHTSLPMPATASAFAVRDPSRPAGAKTTTLDSSSSVDAVIVIGCHQPVALAAVLGRPGEDALERFQRLAHGDAAGAQGHLADGGLVDAAALLDDRD